MANDTYCYRCGQTIHFSPHIKSRNGKFIPLQGKKGAETHQCPAKSSFSNSNNSYGRQARSQWWKNQSQQEQQRHRQWQEVVEQWQQQRNKNKRTVSERIKKYLIILGLSPTCNDIAEIKQAYRKLALLYHPDRSKDPETAGRFIAVNHAYQKCLEELEE